MKVLCIGDLHLPAVHPNYLEFCQDIYEEWQCDTAVFMGDIVDNHAVSFHASDPSLPAAQDEYHVTIEAIAPWRDAFPRAYVCTGNHDLRIHRIARDAGIPPKLFLRDFRAVYRTPNWVWGERFILDNVLYTHGTGTSGKTPALSRAEKNMCSTVMGHNHSVSGVRWSAGIDNRVFGMDVGCGLDAKSLRMAYGKDLPNKPVLSCGVVIDGIPYHEIMPISEGEMYAK